MTEGTVTMSDGRKVTFTYIRDPGENWQDPCGFYEARWNALKGYGKTRGQAAMNLYQLVESLAVDVYKGSLR